MTPEIFQKYIDGLCDREEQQQVEQWLHTCSKEELDGLLLPIWNRQQNPAMPGDQTSDLWKRLSMATVSAEPKGRVRRGLFKRMLTIAAAVITVLVIGIIELVPKKESNQPIATAVQPPPADSNKIAWVHRANTDNVPRSIILEDGSGILLYPNSTIKYPATFDADSRPVFLEGKGVFTIAKDKQRPFTVYSRDIATTALGTKFLVDEHTSENRIHIKLYEGKIIVKENTQNVSVWKEKILLPGNELIYDAGNKTVSVSAGQHEAEGNKKKRGVSQDELSFANMQLIEVFEKLKYKYSARIEYNKADITGMYFTGTISRKDSLPMILQVVARMNGLSIKEDAGKYIVTKAAE